MDLNNLSNSNLLCPTQFFSGQLFLSSYDIVKINSAFFFLFRKDIWLLSVLWSDVIMTSMLTDQKAMHRKCLSKSHCLVKDIPEGQLGSGNLWVALCSRIGWSEEDQFLNIDFEWGRWEN